MGGGEEEAGWEGERVEGLVGVDGWVGGDDTTAVVVPRAVVEYVTASGSVFWPVAFSREPLSAGQFV